MAKILIAAHIDVEPDKRVKALTGAQPFIDAALQQDGCLCYSWAADMNNPERIEVFEEWESEDALAAHFKGAAYANMRDHIGASGLKNAVSAKYRVDAEAPVYDETGTATTGF